jgi:hypothetical protein
MERFIRDLVVLLYRRLRDGRADLVRDLACKKRLLDDRATTLTISTHPFFCAGRYDTFRSFLVPSPIVKIDAASRSADSMVTPCQIEKPSQ